MALEVIQRPEEDLYVEENPTAYDTPYFTSRWNAANLPLVYKISNTKFPVNTEDTTESILTIETNAGFAQLNLDSATYTFLAKGTVKITNTTNYNGIWSIRSVIDANTIVINAPFVADETGNVQNYYNNYSTLVKIYAGLPEYHPSNASKPMTLITDNPITVVPNSSNVATVDVASLVKSKLSLDNDYDVNDLDQFTAFYIEYSEQYDESDGNTVSVTTETFVEDILQDCEAGAANFITNGGFDTNLNDWTQIGGGEDWVQDTGVAKTTLTGRTADESKILTQSNVGLTQGVEYTLTFDYALGTNNVTIKVTLDSIIYEEALTGSGTANVKFVHSGGRLSDLGIKYRINNNASLQDLTLDNVSIVNALTNPCLAYIFSTHSALQPQSKYGGNIGEYVQNFNGGVFANKWLTLMQEPVLFKGNFFDLSTIIPQSVIQSAIQAGGFFLQILEYNKNGVNIEETNYAITQNLGDGIYRFRLDDKTFNDNTKRFTAQILRVPVNLFTDGDQGTFDTTISGITADAESQIVRDTTISFEGSASLRTRSYFDSTDSFIFTAETTTTNETFKLPLIAVGEYDFTIDWGDGTSERITAFDQAEVTHTYASANSYTVNMNGIIKGFSFGEVPDSKNKISNISQWGNLSFIEDRAFDACVNLNVTASDAPNLSETNSLSGFFSSCTSLTYNSSIDNWDVSTIADFSRVFNNCSSFNQSINSWDVSNGTTFLRMFADCTAYNQSINGWDLSNATNLSFLFVNASNYNQPMSALNVSNVTTMESMFDGASVFNQDISSWNVSNVSNFTSMFEDASAFNQNIDSWTIKNTGSVIFNRFFTRATNFNSPLNSWNVTAVNGVSSMFFETAFNQPLNNWNTSQWTTTERMFNGADNFNSSLSGWNLSSCTNMDFMFQNAVVFNQNIDNWILNSTSSFTMNFTFAGATNYNSPLNSWNVSQCTSLNDTFNDATSFSQPLSNWNVGNVTSFVRTFDGADSFNEDITGWDVSSGTTFSGMFQLNDVFNQDISTWNMSNATNLSFMFENAVVFDKNLSSWDITNVTTLESFMGSVGGFSTSNYDAILIGWEAQMVQNNVQADFGVNSNYTLGGAAETARTNLINDHSWIITDGGGV